MIIFAMIVAAITGVTLAWMTKNHHWYALGLFAILMVSMDAVILASKGNPKKASMEWFGDGVRTVVNYQLDEGNAIYVTTVTANLRSRPSVSSAMVATINQGSALLVTGKVSGENWYRVRRESGEAAFIFGNLIAPIDGDELAVVVPGRTP